MAGDANTQSSTTKFECENTAPLGCENVNEGNTTAQHFSGKILYVFMLCNGNYNKYYDFNTTAATTINALIPTQLNFSVVIL
jgi:hypothetical protein